MPYAIADLNLGLLVFLTMSSLAVYPLLIAGWASNSKYALIGALRAVAQTISYEVNMGLIMLNLTLFTGSFDIDTFSEAQEGC